MLPPAMTNVTEVMTSIKPMAMRVVMTSWNTTMPKNTAVTGSKTPKIAVGVEPIYWMASVVHINEITVGNIDNAMILPQSHQLSDGGVVNVPHAKALIAKMIQPTSKTYMVTFMVAIFFMRDLFTNTM